MNNTMSIMQHVKPPHSNKLCLFPCEHWRASCAAMFAETNSRAMENLCNHGSFSLFIWRDFFYLYCPLIYLLNDLGFVLTFLLMLLFISIRHKRFRSSQRHVQNIWLCLHLSQMCKGFVGLSETAVHIVNISVPVWKHIFICSFIKQINGNPVHISLCSLTRSPSSWCITMVIKFCNVKTTLASRQWSENRFFGDCRWWIAQWRQKSSAMAVTACFCHDVCRSVLNPPRIWIC